LSTASGRVGDVITISGKDFKRPEGSTAQIEVHWQATDGKLLATAVPDVNGAFSTTFKVPDGPPGYYVITTDLKDPGVQPPSNAHGVVLFEVQGAAVSPDTVARARTFTETSGPSGSSFPMLLVLSLGVVGLGLFAGGFVAVSRSRRAKVP